MMLKQKKILILSAFSFIIFFAFASVTFAAPKVTDVLAPEVNKALQWGVGIIGVLAAVSFAFGALQYTFFKVADGKDRMLGSVFGLVILLSAYLILKTINPQLVELKLTQVEGSYGMMYTGGKIAAIPMPQNEMNTTEVYKSGYRKATYFCTPDENGSTGNAPNVLYWPYDRPNLKSVDGKTGPIYSHFMPLACGRSVDVPSAGSLQWQHEYAGVYFSPRNGEGALNTPYYGGPYLESQSLKDKPTFSLKIVQGKGDWKIPNKIGVVIHNFSENPRKARSCEPDVIFSNGGDKTFDTSLGIAYADIFLIPQQLDYGKEDGVNFYSDPSGWLETSDSGVFKIPAKDIPLTGLTISAEKIKFDYGCSQDTQDTTCKKDDRYRTAYPNFLKRQGSMKINGNFIVALFSKSNSVSANSYYPSCVTYTEDVDNFANEDFLDANFKTALDKYKKEIIIKIFPTTGTGGGSF